MIFKPCAVVPSYNHAAALPMIAARLRTWDLEVIIVDDGSEAEAAAQISRLHDPEGGIRVHRLGSNQGKGVAVLTGLRLAAERGYTHALQVDADGQHDLERVPDLIASARAAPEALVSGAPVYDDSVPRARRIGRWATHLWVYVETLSFAISDSMCGFRVYPLAATLAVAESEPVGARMDFDTEIMVRLYWRGVRPVMVPVRVTYPPGNTSNFRMLRDNLRITAMHTRLFFGMLARLPRLIRGAASPARPSTHWARLAERGAISGLAFSGWVYRKFGRSACMTVLAPVVLYFFLTGTEQRRASRDFLARALARPPGTRAVIRHFMDFAARGLDMIAAWTGSVPHNAVDGGDRGFAAMMAEGKGGLLIVSHHGNVEVARALLKPDQRDRLTILVHTRNSENFNRILRGLRPEIAARMVQVTELGPETAIALKQRVERGEWVAIAGDRVPVLSKDRVVRTGFLGAEAAFAQGPWILAALLDCPAWTMFCFRSGPGRWTVAIDKLFDRVVLPRADRTGAIRACVVAYAERLEQHCRAYPWQWYNFFDFWAVEQAG